MPEVRTPRSLDDIASFEKNIRNLLRGFVPAPDLLALESRRLFHPLIICPSDVLLTPEELADVEQSLSEIRAGKAHKFKSGKDLIGWLDS